MTAPPSSPPSDDTGSTPQAPCPGSSAAYAAIASSLANHGWALTPSVLDPVEAASLAAECQLHWEEGTFRKAGVGRGSAVRIREDIRSDHVLWLEPGLLTPTQKLFLDRIEQLRIALNRQLFLGLESFHAHFATYPPGSFYAPHLDRHAGTVDRVVTVVYYLNPGWSPSLGGQLRLYHDPERSRFTDIQPALGQAAIFLSSDFWHEVLPATRTRMSITGWYHQRHQL